MFSFFSVFPLLNIDDKETLQRQKLAEFLHVALSTFCLVKPQRGTYVKSTDVQDDNSDLREDCFVLLVDKCAVVHLRAERS